MDAIIERCAGLDQATACVLIGEADRKPRKEIRTFSTMTRDLEAMRDWLKELGVTHVGLESTGIYWKPVHTILEGHFELIVAKAHHIKTVPGQGCRVDRRPGAPRPDQAELRATTANPRTARSRPASALLIRGADHRAEPHAQAAGTSSWPAWSARCSASPAGRC